MKTRDFAYVLHLRPYQNNSYIVECFTPNHGRVSMVAEGVRCQKKKGYLDLFTLFWVEYVLRRDLGALYQFEAEERVNLVGKKLYCGFYLNELLVRFLPKHEPCAFLFECYRNTLEALSKAENIEIPLRSFELHFLGAIGYALPLQYEAYSKIPIVAERMYQYQPLQGLTQILQAEPAHVIRGETILAIADLRWDSASLKVAKYLTRSTIDTLLEGRGLKSREIFK